MVPSKWQLSDCGRWLVYHIRKKITICKTSIKFAFKCKVTYQNICILEVGKYIVLSGAKTG